MNRILRRKGVNGAPITLRVQKRGPDGVFVPVEDAFTADDEIIARISPGGGRPHVASFPCSWGDAAVGEIQVEFPAAVLDGLEGGTYLLSVALTAADVDLALLELEIEEGAGEADPRPTYISYADLEEEYPDLESKMARQNVDQSGFAVVRAKARDWLDLAILNHHRPVRWSGRGNRFITSTGPYSWDWPTSAPPENNTRLADALRDGALMLATPNGERLKEAMVCWCLGRILRRSSSENVLDKADYYAERAESILCTAVAELDTDHDGKANIVVSFRTTRSR